MLLERTVLGIGDIEGGQVIVTTGDCYIVSSLRNKLISLKSGTILNVVNRNIYQTIKDFGEEILELISNEELVIRWER